MILIAMLDRRIAWDFLQAYFQFCTLSSGRPGEYFRLSPFKPEALYRFSQSQTVGGLRFNALAIWQGGHTFFLLFFGDGYFNHDYLLPE